jgi:hypothetical protein
VAGLVVGDGLLLPIGQGHRLPAGAHQDAVAGHLEVTLEDLVLTGSHREEGGFVDEVGQVGAGHARRAPSHHTEVRIGREALRLRVDDEDRLALADLGEGDDDLAVEPAGAQQGRVEDVGAVGGRDHHDALGGLEPVHLGQHLVEGLLPLVVPTAEAGPALATDRVDLVHEDDRLAHLAGALEEVADAAGTDADEHLHEVRAGDGEERDARLAGDGARDEGLARAGRAYEQHALGDPGADLGEALGRLEEVDDLLDVLLHAVVAGHVGERRAGSLGGVGLGLGAADRHDPAHLALGSALHEPEERHEDGDGDQEGQQADQEARGRGGVVDLDALGPQHLEVGVGDAAVERAGGLELAAVRERAVDGPVGVVDLDALDLAVLHLGHEVGVGDGVLVVGAAEQRPHEEDREGEAEQHPQAPPGHARDGTLPALPALVAGRGRRRRREALGAHGDRIRVGRPEPQPGSDLAWGAGST